MKYLQKYKLFEYNANFHISGHHWDYQLGYLWSSKSAINNNRNDIRVDIVKVEDDGLSNSLSNRTVQPLFQEYIGTSNLNELCAVYISDYYHKEFKFLKKGLLEKRYYVNIAVPNKPDIIQQVPNFKGDYLDIVGEIIGHKFSKKERKDLEDGKDSKYYNGSWHITVGIYDVDGIKMVSADIDGTPAYIMRRTDLEKLVDMTETYSYYSFVDLKTQISKVNGNKIEYNEISSLFMNCIDDGLELNDFTQIDKNQMMVKFMCQFSSFSDELVFELSKSIKKFCQHYNCKLNKMDLTRNHMRYVDDSNKTWLLNQQAIMTMNFEDLKNVKLDGNYALYLIFSF